MKNKGVVSRVNSASEPNLATAGKKTNDGFPPGITVDELWLYRKKRAAANLWPGDHIKLPEGTFKQLKSEYTRRFKNFYDFSSCEDLRSVRAAKPEDNFKIEGDEEFVQRGLEKPLRPKPHHASFERIDVNDETEMREKSSESERLLTEIKAKYVKYPPTLRPPLVKHHTNLKLEGDLYTTTEQADQFIQYLLTNRPRLVKRPTTLKLEGKMNINTENRDKFVPYEVTPRPPLIKKFTNLHLEGDLNIVTEKQEQFVRYEVQRRPPLTKKETNLVIEGELDLLPEYRKEFIEYKVERPKLVLPINNLKTNGFYDFVPDVSPTFHHQIHPQIPNLRNTDPVGDDLALKTRLSRTRENSFKFDATMELQTENRYQFVEKPPSKAELVKVENNLKLHGRIDLNPEYRNAYIDYNQSAAPAPRRRRQEGSLKAEGPMEITPEYRRSYVDFPRRRPQIKRPECSLSSEGEVDHTTEKSKKYVPFLNAPRTKLAKRPSELKLEGNIECQPEYRKAYIDYLVRERTERKHRPLDNLSQPQQRIVEDDSVLKTTLTNVVIETPQPETSDSVEEIPQELVQIKRIKSSRNRSLSQIESSAFGPKLTVPGKASSRSTSPDSIASRRSRRASTSPGKNRHKTFGKPVLVQNLASRSATPALPLVDVTAKNKWMRDSSVESSSAFIVLDKNGKNSYDKSGRKLSYWNRNSFE